MTVNKQFKLQVRRYAQDHGLSYADARRHVLEATQAATTPEGAAPQHPSITEPRRIPCPGAPNCPHPAPHIHLQAADGHGQIWDGDGDLADPFDLTQPATIVAPAAAMLKPHPPAATNPPRAVRG